MIPDRRAELVEILDQHIQKVKEAYVHASMHDFTHAVMKVGEPALFDKLLAWTDRWAGRPSVDQVEEVIADGHLGLVGWRRMTALAILDLYPTPSPERKRVSREQIERVLDKYVLPTCTQGQAKRNVLADLCFILGVEEEKPARWCDHWKYSQYMGWSEVTDGPTTRPVPHDNYKFCEFCGTPRPDERGGGR